MIQAAQSLMVVRIDLALCGAVVWTASGLQGCERGVGEGRIDRRRGLI